jgi:hypothetical protein
MTELRLHRDIYTVEAITEALRVFTRFGRFERADEGSYHVLRVTAKTPEREKHIVRELGNHVLGLTRRAEVSP